MAEAHKGSTLMTRSLGRTHKGHMTRKGCLQSESMFCSYAIGNQKDTKESQEDGMDMVPRMLGGAQHIHPQLN